MPTGTVSAGSAGSAIRSLREAAGLSIRELARAAHVDHTYLSRVEAAERVPSDRWVATVTQALGRLLGERAT
jgi:transcriptional regulator with XRE-family HTH domain